MGREAHENQGRQDGVQGRCDQAEEDEAGRWESMSRSCVPEAPWVEEARREGLRIYARIKASGLTQNEIAERMGISAPNLSSTLKRVRDGRFTLKTLAALGLAIGVYWDLKLLPRPSAPTPDGSELLVLCLGV